MSVSPSSRPRVKSKCNDVIRAILECMKRNEIELPSKYQKSKVAEELPQSPTRRQDNTFRRFEYLEHLDEVAPKLNKLLVYAETAKELNSELIATVVLEKLKICENNLINSKEGILVPLPIPPSLPGTKLTQEARQRVTYDRLTLVGSNLQQRFEDIDTPGTHRINVDLRSRHDIEKFGRMGAIKKKLPEYERDLKGTKLPEHALPLLTLSKPSNSHSELEKRRKVDRLQQKLRKTSIANKRNIGKDSENA